MRALSQRELLALRVRNQGLADAASTTVLDAVRRVGALQAQSSSAVRLAIRARTTGLTHADVAEALGTARPVVRTSLMRGTLHLVPADDVRWMAALLGPIVRAQYQRRRVQLGLTDELCRAALDQLPALMAGEDAVALGDIMDRLAQRGITIDRSTQAPIHLMLLACAEGVVCRGPDAGRSPAFMLTDAWVAPAAARSRDDALAELARRYLAGRGPATVHDFRYWSGLGAADCTAAFDHIAPELVHVVVVEQRLVALASDDLDPPTVPTVRLLGMWDEYLLSYRSRDALIATGHANQIFVGGVIQAAVLVDGIVVGAWRIVGSGRTRRLCVEAFSPLSRDVRDALDSEVTDLARFLDVGLRLDLTN